jgi:cytoskeleton protein RodZ
MATRIGQALREARLERGIELSEVERVTKIRVKFLRAMEENRWEELPAPVYARGFLSAYARYLGLDDGPLVEEYRRGVESAWGSEPIPEGVLRRGQLSRERARWPRGPLLAGLLALVVVGLAIGVALGGSDDGGQPERGKRKQTAARTNTEPESTAPSDQSVTSPGGQSVTGASEVSVELRPTEEVWVCLIDADGDHLVNGETLVAGDSRGPFASQSFEMTFGNGSIEMTVDDQPVAVPGLAEPLGYRVGPSGVSRLASSSQPDCL